MTRALREGPRSVEVGIRPANGTAAAPVARRAAVETVGQRIRRIRIERGFSQRELAAPGVSYAYISRIEADARTPSAKALQALAERLGCTALYLATGHEDERCPFCGRVA